MKSRRRFGNGGCIIKRNRQLFFVLRELFAPLSFISFLFPPLLRSLLFPSPPTLSSQRRITRLNYFLHKYRPFRETWSSSLCIMHSSIERLEKILFFERLNIFIVTFTFTIESILFVLTERNDTISCDFLAFFEINVSYNFIYIEYFYFNNKKFTFLLTNLTLFLRGKIARSFCCSTEYLTYFHRFERLLLSMTMFQTNLSL